MFNHLRTKSGNILRLYIQEKLSAKSVCVWAMYSCVHMIKHCAAVFVALRFHRNVGGVLVR